MNCRHMGAVDGYGFRSQIKKLQVADLKRHISTIHLVVVVMVVMVGSAMPLDGFDGECYRAALLHFLGFSPVTSSLYFIRL